MDKQQELETIKQAFEDGIISEQECKKFSVDVLSDNYPESVVEESTEDMTIYFVLGFVLPFFFLYFCDEKRSKAVWKGTLAFCVVAFAVVMIFFLVEWITNLP